MAYVKLDTKILDSTLWVDRIAREIFVTALLMAEPREFLTEQPQIGVRSLDLSGWSAPANWYGWVPAAGIGILRRAGLSDVEAGLCALERLCSPEPDSRSPDYGGRRMIRVDGGYLVLNYMRYRDFDHSAAERQRRLRERRRAKGQEITETVTRDSHSVTRDSNAASRIADADADADAKKENTPTVASRPSEAEFEAFKAAYPKRNGPQPWARARRAISARIKAGDTIDAITEGASRYYEWCRRTDKIGSEHVMQAATFCGPDRHYLNTFSDAAHEITWRPDPRDDQPLQAQP